MTALLRNQANIEGACIDMWKPLHKAAEFHRIEIFKALLEGAKKKGEGQEGWPLLHVTTIFGHVDQAKMLLDKGANIEAVAHRMWELALAMLI